MAVRSPFLRHFELQCPVSLRLYLVGCDLLAEGDYASFKQRLRTLDAVQVLSNQWALRS
jgi:hypothetical protein